MDENPSLRGMLLGYMAELKLAQLLEANPWVTKSTKSDDHDRAGKGDRVIVYKGAEFIIECKSLQTNTVTHDGQRWVGRVQVDASDKRPVILADGSTINTTCLRVGEFDVLAVNLFDSSFRSMTGSLRKALCPVNPRLPNAVLKTPLTGGRKTLY